MLLRVRMLTQKHVSTMTGHTEARQIYDTIRKSYFWPHTVSDVLNYVKHCRSWQRHWQASTHQLFWQLFCSISTLEFVAMGIIETLSKTRAGTTYIAVMMDLCSQLTGAIPTRTTRAADVVQYLISDGVISYVTPKRLLTEKRPQFAGNDSSVSEPRWQGSSSRLSPITHRQMDRPSGITRRLCTDFITILEDTEITATRLLSLWRTLIVHRLIWQRMKLHLDSRWRGSIL